MKAIEDKFKKIGAELDVRILPMSREITVKGFRGGPSYKKTISLSPAPFSIDIDETKGKEKFILRVAADTVDKLDISILECIPEERHLVLFARLPEDVRLPARRGGSRPERTVTRISKMHFLCGHDERHWFVAGVNPCSTVREAKDSLKPLVIREADTGIKKSRRNKRSNDAWVRQGEWFFVPTPDLVVQPHEIRKNEPITRSGVGIRGRGGGKPHTAQFACRSGGEPVYVRGNTTLTPESYERLDSTSRIGYRSMLRNPQLYVKGTVRHLDHATIDLGEIWHRVYMNTERHELRGQTVAFLD